ncbi:MAG: DUF1801 domain-containing protein [Acidimicrobiales bacterium]|jgi:uncharacterized protein YdhG (YjbR/CyaY superfamily)|nr:DUF1801 domain-containing protein [Acidimicrobiales bacterium]
MASAEIDDYLASVDEPARSTLEALRRSIRAVVPDAEEGLSYGVPAFKVQGRPVAGFAAFERHLSYFPHSGAVVEALAAELAGYRTSKGTVQFALDAPLPDELVAKLVSRRLAEIG